MMSSWTFLLESTLWRAMLDSIPSPSSSNLNFLMYFFRLFSDAMTECGLLMLCIEQNEGQDNQITFIITSPQHMPW